MEKSHVDMDETHGLKEGEIMDSQNICKFLPIRREEGGLDILRFVQESAPGREKRLGEFHYQACIVGRGSGVLHTADRSFVLARGDLFFTFPRHPVILENRRGLQYLYIAFLGGRANALLNRASICKEEPARQGYPELVRLWRDAVRSSAGGGFDLLAESILLYTLSKLSSGGEDDRQTAVPEDMICRIKGYIDEECCDAELTLQAVAKRFSYHPKYLSVRFKQAMGVGFCEYLQTRRIQRACELMQRGITSIQEIAYRSGYQDPLYFSRVFKERIGVSPRRHMDQLHLDGENRQPGERW